MNSSWRRIAETLAVVTAGLAAALVQFHPAAAGEPHGTLSEALAGFRGRTHTAILAEIPQLPLRGGVSALPRSAAALEAISSSFHLYAVQRPASVAFQRRYPTASEMPDLELPELTAAASELWRLIAPHAAHTDALTETADHDRFYGSLTHDQLQAMRSKQGFPIAQLTQPQRELWAQVNRTHLFGHENEMSGRANLIFSGWRSDRLAYRTARARKRDGSPVEQRQRLLFFPDPSGLRGQGMIGMLDEGEDPTAKRPADLAPVPAAGETLPAPPQFSKAFVTEVVGADGETTLAALIDRLEQASGQQITVPAYARQRPLLAFVSRARAADVMVGLEDLYGWDVRPSGKKYAFGRPRPAAPQNYAELVADLRMVTPVAMRHVWSADSTAPAHDRGGADRFLEQVRRRRQLGAIVAALTAEKGRNWQSVDLTSLSEKTQRLIANHCFATQMVESIVSDPQVLKLLIEQEHGFFRVEGQDPNPLLTFHVPVTGMRNMWGWIVGSARRG